MCWQEECGRGRRIYRSDLATSDGAAKVCKEMEANDGEQADFFLSLTYVKMCWNLKTLVKLCGFSETQRHNWTIQVLSNNT